MKYLELEKAKILFTSILMFYWRSFQTIQVRTYTNGFHTWQTEKALMLMKRCLKMKTQITLLQKFF